MQIRTPAEARYMLRLATERWSKPGEQKWQAKRTWRFMKQLFEMQQKLRRSKKNRIAALCGRRSGKSFLACAMLLAAAGDHPDSTCAYLATTREQARRIMWRELKRFHRAFSLGIKFTKPNGVMVATLTNGSEISCLGALNEKDVDRLRGTPFVLVVIDEAASFPARGPTRRHDIKRVDAGQLSESEKAKEAAKDRAKRLERDLLYRLWREVLSPSMLDFDGKVLMLGTPAAHCNGYFFEITQPQKSKRVKGWDVFQWTVVDNPHVPKIKKKGGPKTAAEWLERMRDEEGIDESDPAYQREWLGRWVHSADSLVYYAFSEAKNTYGDELAAALPLFSPKNGTRKVRERDWLDFDFHNGIPDKVWRKHDWFFGASVDLGYDDPTVIGVFMWSDTSPNVYLVSVYKHAKLIPARIAAELKRLQKKVERELGAGAALSFTVIDQGGGAGKMIAEEFAERWAIPCKGAEKTRKPTYIELCNGDFSTGRFKIHKRCLPVLEEISVLQWDARFPGRKEDPRFGNDACDMMLYGWREARHYTSGKLADEPVPDEALPEPGSAEANAEIEDAMEQKFLKDLDKDARMAKANDGEHW